MPVSGWGPGGSIRVAGAGGGRVAGSRSQRSTQPVIRETTWSNETNRSDLRFGSTKDRHVTRPPHSGSDGDSANFQPFVVQEGPARRARMFVQ